MALYGDEPKKKNKISGIISAITSGIGDYKKFKESLPDNLRETSEKDYAMRRYWRRGGKPEDFEEAKSKDMFTPVYHEDEGKIYYHGQSVDDKGKFVKPKTHPSVHMELDWFKNSDSDDAKKQRENFTLKEGRRFYKYKKKK
jgi:hypothetical protein